MKADKVVIGILAHVDAGKTTLAESILYLSGTIRTIGRVDHKNAFLDTFELEKLRGITIFSKQAEFSLENQKFTLLDTPGHVDFSAEMERTLQILDYAILVINGADGIQGHVMTLWNLLKRYQIPVFLFVNKMDQDGTDKSHLMTVFQKRLSENCVEFSECQDELFYESLAMCDEQAMECYLSEGTLENQQIAELIGERKIFPCYFGSALKLTGVDIFLDGLKTYIKGRCYPERFGARVYKIGRDVQGNRLTYLKVTGGCLKVKMPLTGLSKQQHQWEEKVDQLKICSGDQHQPVSEVGAGAVCAVTGLSQTYAGQGLGIEKSVVKPILEPVLTYRLQLDPKCDVFGMYRKLCLLEEEEPQLHMIWAEQTGEIHIQVMGEVQIEILKSMIRERFNETVEFYEGSIIYKETIHSPVNGAGHFEPLKHYAEVHLLLEPAQPGSGITISSSCNEDMLDRNWQNLILTHLQEKKHRGVLTGAEITDIKITLTAGRAHQKHTEGGDFRQATYRAVRQGLKKAQSILLEPVYEFRLEIPADKAGRAMADIQKMSGTFRPPELEGGAAVITGTAPVSEMRNYQNEVAAYSRGTGQIFYTLKGYRECHNAEQVIAEIGYDPETDVQNPSSSVFCSHGSGFSVPWDQADEYMHVQNNRTNCEREQVTAGTVTAPRRPGGVIDTDKELEEIFARTYGPVRPKAMKPAQPAKKSAESSSEAYRPIRKKEEYLLVDGYNIIFAWEELKALAADNISGARDKLCDILCDYQGYKKNTVIVVFDAYKTEHCQRTVQEYHNIHIVYTKKAETADQYIEKTVETIGRKYQVTVATSDALEQLIIWGLGAVRLSASGLREEMAAFRTEIRTEYLEKTVRVRQQVLTEDILKQLEVDE